MPIVAASTWLNVLARGRMAGPLVAIEFFLTRPEPLAPPATLSLRPARGRAEGVVLECSFCWCRSNRSRLAKQRVHSEQANGFSLVWDRSWRFRCSRRANDRMHVVHTCGRGLSVFGGGNGGTGGNVEEELDRPAVF